MAVKCPPAGKTYQFELSVLIPPTSQGEVWVPLFGAGPAATVAEGDALVFAQGQFQSGVEGVVSARLEAGYVVFSTLAGAYTFHV